MAEVLVDLVRLGHLVGLALGFGLALYADSRFLGTLAQPVDRARLEELRRIHVHVALALGLLWVTGILLLAIRTGLDSGQVTPKLVAKLSVVGVMTLNARLIACRALPILERAGGASFCRLPRGARLRMAAIGAVSAASWVSALGLGAIGAMKLMGALPLALILSGVYLAALSTGVVLALLAPLILPRPRLRRFGMPGAPA